jgi:hypothetical protein
MAACKARLELMYLRDLQRDIEGPSYTPWVSGCSLTVGGLGG